MQQSFMIAKKIHIINKSFLYHFRQDIPDSETGHYMRDKRNFSKLAVRARSNWPFCQMDLHFV